MDDRRAEGQHLAQAIRHLEAKLMKAARGPVTARDLLVLNALYEARRRLIASDTARS
jgi:hypothetical protein